MQVREECGRLVYYMTGAEYDEYLQRGEPLTDDDDFNIALLTTPAVEPDREEGEDIRLRRIVPARGEADA